MFQTLWLVQLSLLGAAVSPNYTLLSVSQCPQEERFYAWGVKLAISLPAGKEIKGRFVEEDKSLKLLARKSALTRWQACNWHILIDDGSRRKINSTNREKSQVKEEPRTSGSFNDHILVSSIYSRM